MNREGIEGEIKGKRVNRMDKIGNIMRKKGIILMMIVMGCNGGGVKGEGTGGDGRGAKSLSEVLLEVGRSTENVFYAFLGLMADTLGFTAKVDTKKENVGKYFDSIREKIGEASIELEQVSEKAPADVDKDGLLNKTIKEAVDESKKVLSTLKGHLGSLGQVGDSNVVGYAHNAQGQGTAPNDEQLKAMFNALKGIVDIAIHSGVKALKIGATTLTVDGGADNKDGAKILATQNNPDADVAGKAAAILASVSGEEMLEAIVSSKENDVALTDNASAMTTAMNFAKGGQASHLAHTTDAKAAAVAGGIALRSLVKSGKLAAGANPNAKGGEKDVQGVGIVAVNKLLVTIEDIIKKTVKNVLGTAKQKIDNARGSQVSALKSNK
ncbi:variable large family protein [Borrelia crocidurae]|uniref:Variable large protein n=1 Tax=Borrelia crocidurae (strain Achema) TaxID=1155096 RepID=I0FFE5_BORCA|nr:variable large family protein [Borrelia crocidurae]AFI32201.1 variable large protein 7 [Borrelia crocidurae str. Achema]